MDGAVAAIVIGIGSSLAAMALPLKYPNAPRWVLESSWWGGVLLIAVGLLSLATDPVQLAIDAFDWLWALALEIQALPGFWLVIVFAAGLTARRWFMPFWRFVWIREQAIPQVKEWLTPNQAIEAFVNPEILSKHRVAETKFKSLKETIDEMEAEKAVSDGPKREVIEDQVMRLKADLDTLEYLTSHRKSDVMENLYEQLREGVLVGKGIIHRFGKPRPSYIKANYWKVYFYHGEFLDVETATAFNLLDTYSNVLIGKVESPEAL